GAFQAERNRTTWVQKGPGRYRPIVGKVNTAAVGWAATSLAPGACWARLGKLGKKRSTPPTGGSGPSPSACPACELARGPRSTPTSQRPLVPVASRQRVVRGTRNRFVNRFCSRSPTERHQPPAGLIPFVKMLGPIGL